MSPSNAGPLLEVRNVEVVYNDVVLVLRGVSLTIDRGEIVTLLGANGAGKTTLLRAVTGLLEVHRGRVTKGGIRFGGKAVEHQDPSKLVRAGVSQVMEGRRIFAELTVDENLKAGAYTVRDKAEMAASYERVMELFPVLAPRRKDTAGYLSGGEQQMLAIARGLVARPKVIMFDEPSLGLAPALIEDLFSVLAELRDEGRTILLVDQMAGLALSVADRGYVLESGRVVHEGSASDLKTDKSVEQAYLGGGSG